MDCVVIHTIRSFSVYLKDNVWNIDSYDRTYNKSNIESFSRDHVEFTDARKAEEHVQRLIQRGFRCDFV